LHQDRPLYVAADRAMPSEPHALIVRWPGKAWTATGLASRTLPLVLSLTAGSTDIIGFLGLNGLFTAHITGNIVVLAAHIVAGDPTIFSYVLSVPVFMLVVLLTRLLAGTLEQAGVSTLQPLLLLQLLFLVAFFCICVVPGSARGACPAYRRNQFGKPGSLL
jgi:uncharacterized protein DUF1275